MKKYTHPDVKQSKIVYTTDLDVHHYEVRLKTDFDALSVVLRVVQIALYVVIIVGIVSIVTN